MSYFVFKCVLLIIFWPVGSNFWSPGSYDMPKAIEEVWERKSMPMTNWKHFDHHLFKKALCTFDQFSSLDLHQEDLILLCPTFDLSKINILTNFVPNFISKEHGLHIKLIWSLKTPMKICKNLDLVVTIYEHVPISFQDFSIF